MSLINNALKRISESAAKNTDKPLNYAQPVYRFGQRQKSAKRYIILGIILSAMALVLIFIYFWKNPEKTPSLFAFLIKTNKPAITSTNTAKINAYEIARTKIVSVAKNQSNNLYEATGKIAENKTNAAIASPPKSDSKTTEKAKEQQTAGSDAASTVISNGTTTAQNSSAPSESEKLLAKLLPEEKVSKPKVIPTTFPELKLNGIFYQKTKPSAIINGKTVFIGDEINGVKVISIEPDTVTVQFYDETRILKM